MTQIPANVTIPGLPLGTTSNVGAALIEAVQTDAAGQANSVQLTLSQAMAAFTTTPTLAGLTVNPTASSAAQGVIVDQSISGSIAKNFAVGSVPDVSSKAMDGIYIASDNATAGGFLYDFAVIHLFGGAALSGGRVGQLSWLVQTATCPSNASNFYVGAESVSDTLSGDGGTNTGAGALGSYYGANPQVRLGPSAANCYVATGAEFDNYNAVGASMRYNWGINIVSFNAVQGGSSDAGIVIYSGASSSLHGSTYGPGAGFHQGLSFAEIASSGLQPVDSTGTLIGTHLETLTVFTVAAGIDFTKVVFSGNAFQSNGFKVAQSGFVGIGTTTPTSPLDVSTNATSPPSPAVGALLHLTGADSTTTGITIDAFGSNSNVALRRANGSNGGPSALVSSDIMGSFQWRGYGGAAYGAAAAIVRAVSIENWNATSQGARIDFLTNPIGTTSNAVRASIAQGFSVGTTSDPGSGNIIAANFLNSGGFTRVASNFSAPASSTTLVDITGLSAALLTGGIYDFEAVLYATAGSTGGTKMAIACTGTATNIVYDAQIYAAGVLVQQGRATALLGAVSAASSVTPTIRVVGTIAAANSGTMTVQIAQVAATTTSTVILAGSTLKVFQLS